VLFSRACPLFDTGLTIGMRLLYTSVTWSYITNTFAVPCAVLVPFIALVFGVYPLVLNRDFALAATLYFSASTLVTSYCTNRKHIKPLWFCIVSCHLLWFTFTKALFNVLLRKITKRKVVFKSTKKKGEDDGRNGKPTRRFCRPPANVGDMEGTLDAWVLVASFCFSFITAVVGLFQIIDKPFTAQGDFKFYLMLSVFWAVYNMIPPSLFIFYCYQKGHLFEDFCSFCLTLSYLVAIAGILCTWLVPDDYNMSQVLNVSLQFFEAQRSGKVPRISNTPWRGNSGLWDSVLLPNGKNYSLLGGWYDDGGMLKLSYTTAFTTSMLAWAYWDFKQGYKVGGNTEFGANTIRWGADYLMKASVTNISANGAAMQPIVVAQVRGAGGGCEVRRRRRAGWAAGRAALAPRPPPPPASPSPGPKRPRAPHRSPTLPRPRPHPPRSAT
jgi:endoglucanase